MRILLLGNSLSTANQMPNTLAKILCAEVVVHARSGARLAEHLNSATLSGQKTQKAFAEGQWDYVILQEMSKAPAVHTTAFLKSAEQLCAQIHAIGATPVFFATWAYGSESKKLKQIGMDYDEMAFRMITAYRKACSDYHAVLADVCTAFRNENNRQALYASDGVHPSKIGSVLAASVLAQAIIDNETNRVRE